MWEVLVLLGISLAVITLLGHGIWVATAWLIRALLGQESKPPTRPPRCPRCEYPFDAGRETCAVCEWPGALISASARARAYARIREQLNDWARAGVLDAQEHARLLQAVQTETERAPQPTVAPSPLRFRAPELPPIPLESAPRAEAPEPAFDTAPRSAEALKKVLERMHDAPLPLEATPEPTGGVPTPIAVEIVAEVVESADIPAPPAPPHRPVRVEPLPEPPAPPRRSFAELFVSFMEEKNIRWGELIGGLLIVSCSIALVISFWTQIAERPVLKYVVFNGVTTALFGAAFYTERRWKLPNTSRGLFIIAGLLVPLNFLAMAAFGANASTVPVPLTFVGEAIALALFGALLWLAGRSIAPEFSTVLSPAILLSLLAELLVRHLIVRDPAIPALLGVGALPTVAMLATALAVRWRSGAWSPVTEAQGLQLFRMLGLVAFSSLVAAGLLIFRAGANARTMEILSPLLALFACGPIAIGMLLWRRLKATDLHGMRIAGTAIAVAGVMLMFLAVLFAWPQPAMMIAVLLVEALVLVAVARISDIPAALLPASLSACAAYVLAWYGFTKQIDWRIDSAVELLDPLLRAETGIVLVGSAIACAALAAWRGIIGKREEAAYLGAAAGLNAAVSLALVTFFGLGRAGDPHHVTWVYLLYGTAALAAARWVFPHALAAIGSLLLLVASVQGVVYAGYGQFEQHWLMAFLLPATTFTLLAGAAGWWRWLASDGWRETVTFAAGATTAVAFLLAQWGFFRFNAGTVGAQLAWIAALWFALAYLTRSSGVFAIFQATITQAALAGVTGYLQQQPWYKASARPLLDPWTLETWGVTLAGSCLFWMLAAALLRRITRKHDEPGDSVVELVTWRERLAELHTVAPSLGDACLGVAIALLVAVATYAVVPGVAQELAPRSFAASLAGQAAQTGTRVVPPLASFEVLNIPHAHGWTWGAWALFGTVVAVMLAELRVRRSRLGVVTFLSVLGVGCLLISARFELDVAAASALRWTTAIFLLAVSALIWLNAPLAQLAGRFGWRFAEPTEREAFAADAWVTALTAMVLPLVGMGVYVGLAAIGQRPPDSFVAQSTIGLLALFLVAGVIGSAMVRLEGTERAARAPRAWLRDLGRLVTILGAMPLVVIVLYVVSSSLRGNPIVGPNAGSLFERIGLAASYAGPLLLITITLLGHAIWQRSSSLAMAGGLMLNLSATAGYLLAPRGAPLTLDAVLWVKLAQLNAAIAAGFAVAWTVAAVWRSRGQGHRTLPENGLRATQAVLGLILLMMVLVPSAFVFWWEASLLPIHKVIGGPWGWAALALSVLAVGLHVHRTREPESASAGENWLQRLLAKPIAEAPLFAAALWTLSVMSAFSVLHVFPLATDWDAFHTLLMGHLLSAAAMLALGGLAVRSGTVRRAAALRVVPCVGVFGLLTCLVALRATVEDSARPGWWWSLVGVGVAAVLSAVTAAFAERRRYLYYASACVCLFAITLFNSPANTLAAAGVYDRFTLFMWFIAVALAAPAAVWLWIEKLFIAQNSLGRLRPVQVGAHRVVAGLPTFFFAWTVFVGLEADVYARPIVSVEWLGWLTLGLVAVAVAMSLWDARAKGALLALYLTGFLGIAFAVDRFDLPLKWILLNGAVISAAYAIATSYLWSIRAGCQRLAQRLRMPVDAESAWNHLLWLVPANCLLIIGVLSLVTYIVFTYDDLAQRLLAAKAAWFQVAAFVFLAKGAERNPLRFAALALGVGGGVLWGWAWLDPGAHSVMDRGVVLMAVLAGAGVVYGFLFSKFFRAASPWEVVGRALTPYCIGGAVLTLGTILGGETSAYVSGTTVEVASWGITVVAFTLIGLVAAAIVAAVVPGRDPLGLSERGRQAYVYGAEALLAATFLHIRVCKPEWFGEDFQRWWPLIVMAIAFVGVGLSEWFRRKQHAVLSEPLQRTGALLPMLPVLGFWMIDSSTNYSLLLVVVGGLYATLAMLRKSFGFGVLAALAVNGALWYHLQQQPGLGLLEHPQIWLIPPAVCVLIASYLNRSRLNTQQMTQLRYGCAMVIYVSSTADIFSNGMDENPWLALVLAGLAVIGVMAGILLRVRAFLYLGTSFLCLALVCMVWHAAVDLHHTWIAYASGIALGALIYAGFAVMEKKRSEFQHLLERVREWDA